MLNLETLEGLFPEEIASGPAGYTTGASRFPRAVSTAAPVAPNTHTHPYEVRGWLAGVEVGFYATPLGVAMLMEPELSPFTDAPAVFARRGGARMWKAYSTVSEPTWHNAGARL